MGDYKASQILLVQELLKKGHPEKESAYFASLTPAEREFYKSATPLSWMPIEISASMTTKAMPILFPGELLHSLYEFGRVMAHHDLSGIYRIMVRISSVSFMFKQTPKIWKLYHRQGTMHTQMGNGHGEMILENYPGFPEANYHIMMGYIQSAVSLNGVKNVRVEGKRVSQDAIHFAVTWD